MKKATLRDIAREVGVSVTTASLALSGKGRISEPVRTAVIDAAARLDYDRKPIVAGPDRRRAIGVLLNIDAHWGFVWSFIQPIVAEIDRIFRENGYDVHLIPVHDSIPDPGMADRLVRSSYRGVFTLHWADDGLFASLEEHKLPVIIIMNSNYQDRYHSILVDDFQGSYEGTMHLIELGHRVILYAGTPRKNLPKLTTDRYYGFRKALEESGLPVRPEENLSCEASNTQLLDANLRAVFSRPRRPSAIFAIDDDMAIRIVALLRHSGIRVPEDVSIVAPGDLLDYSDPHITPISTLKIDTRLMGRLACDMMFRRMSGEHDGVHVIKVKQQLVQRGSTKPIPVAGFAGDFRAERTAKERFMRAFARTEGEGVARWLGASRELISKAGAELDMDEEQFRIRIGDDLRFVSPDPMGQGGRTIDAFGIERRGAGYGQPTSHPLGDSPTIEKLRDYPWPDPHNEEVTGIRDRIAPLADRFAVAGGSWSPFWHDAVDLVGMETMASLMYDDPIFVETMLNRIVDYYVGLNTRTFEEAGDLIDIVFIRNDFGTQTGPLIGLEHFVRFIAPCVRRLVDVAHRYDVKVVFYSSGGIRPLVSSLVATGIDALHGLQPDCPGMQPAAVKRVLGDSVVLSGGVNARGALLRGTPEEVRRDVLETLRVLAPGGGYLAAPSVDAVTDDVPVANILAMYDTVAEWRGE